jgi:hypothetical protein
MNVYNKNYIYGGNAPQQSFSTIKSPGVSMISQEQSGNQFFNQNPY